MTSPTSASVGAPPSTTEVKLSAIESITLPAKVFARYGNMPFFANACIGYFVRVRIGGDGTGYILGRITDAAVDTVSPHGRYEWNGSTYCLTIRIDSLAGVDLRATAISSSAPRSEEFAVYCVDHPGSVPTPQVVADLRARIDSQITRHALTPDEAQSLAAFNDRMGKAGGNPISLMTQLEQRLLYAETNQGGARPIAFSQHRPSGNAVDSGEGMLTAEDSFLAERRQSTQMFDAATPRMSTATQLAFASPRGEGRAPSFSSPLGATGGGPGFSSSQAARLAAAAASAAADPTLAAAAAAAVVVSRRFDEYVATACAEQERLAQLTERNRLDNRIAWALSDQHEQALRRKGKLQEEGLLWEVDDKERRKLCQEYDAKQAEGDAKKDGGKKEGGKAAGKDVPPEDALLKRCVEANREDSAGPIGSQIDASVLGRALSARSASQAGASQGFASPVISDAMSTGMLLARLPSRTPRLPELLGRGSPSLGGRKRSREEELA